MPKKIAKNSTNVATEQRFEALQSASYSFFISDSAGHVFGSPGSRP